MLVYSITSKSSLTVIENVKKELEKKGKEVSCAFDINYTGVCTTEYHSTTEYQSYLFLI